MTLKTVCMSFLLLSSCRDDVLEENDKDPMPETDDGTQESVSLPSFSQARRAKVRFIQADLPNTTDTALFEKSPAHHRQEMISLWNRLPKKERQKFFTVLDKRWTPMSHLPIMRFAVRSFDAGTDMTSEIASLGQSVACSGTQSKIAAFLGSRNNIDPKYAIALIVAAMPGAKCSASDFTDALAMKHTLVTERLCLLAFKNGFDWSLYSSQAVCRLPYAMIQHDPDLISLLNADADLFAATVEKLEDVPVAQRAWWCTSTVDREEVAAFFLRATVSEWQAIEPSATALLPYVRSGDKAATLTFLASHPDGKGVVSQVVSYLDNFEGHLQATKVSRLLKVYSGIAAPLRAASFEHAISVHKEVASRAADKQSQSSHFDLAKALELFGSLTEVADMDAMQAVLIRLVFGKFSALDPVRDTPFVLMTVLEIRREARLSAAAMALDLCEYENKQAQARWNMAIAPYSLRKVSGRMRAVEHGIAEGRMPQMWGLLRELERVGCNIVRRPVEIEDGVYSLTNLLSVLSSTRTERYGELRDGAAMLASPFPEVNLGNLIALGRCREVSPLSLAQSASPIFRALQTRFPDAPADAFVQTQMLQALCKAHRTGDLSARVNRAAVQIEQGVAVDWVRQHLNEPLNR